MTEPDDMTEGELESICRHIEKRCVTDASRIKRLVRLGLWAQRQGIPALNEPAEFLACECCDSKGTVQRHFDKALEALPKEPCPACTRGEFPHRNCVLR